MGRQLRFDLGSHFFLGDNLDILRTYIAEESVDLIYLDPPFNSNRSYNAIFKHVDGTPAAAQIKAFDDTWEWNELSNLTFRRAVEHGGEVSKVLRAFQQILDNCDMLAYLTMMAPRLVELERVLKRTGSIFLHCDPTASHYLKLLMDAVFGPENMANEVIWKRANAHNDPKRFGRISDSILFYRKSPAATWNTQYTPYREDYYKSHFKQDEQGRYFRTVPLDAPRHGEGSPGLLYDWHGKLPARSRTWAVGQGTMEEYERSGRIRYTRTGTPTLLQYADEMPGAPVQNIWSDIPPVNPQAKERLGYPTQKPLALLERIISASSQPGDVVLDPFCGCGTAVDAAERLDRRWIGIDITKVALDVVKERLKKQKVDFTITIVPPTIEEAEVLAEQDKFGFQQWIANRLGIEADIRKGADRGIDCDLVKYDLNGRSWRAIVSVKGGGVNVAQVRDLVGTVQREGADAGVFVTLKKPTKPMLQEALDAGLTDDDLPKIQILTVSDLFEGKMPRVPHPEPVALRPIEIDGKVERPKGSAKALSAAG